MDKLNSLQIRYSKLNSDHLKDSAKTSFYYSFYQGYICTQILNDLRSWKSFVEKVA